MSAHRVFAPLTDPTPNTTVVVTGDEAHHAARVKRLAEGDPVEIANGRGAIAHGRVAAIRKARAEWELSILVARVELAPPVRPALHVLASSPKGPRLEEMIDGLSQVGAAAWSPLITARTVVEPREGKLSRLARVAAESAKQCARAWTLEIGDPIRLDDALALRDVPLVLAHASGVHFVPTGAPEIRLLIGPEGDWTPDEMERAAAAGARVNRFGPHVMRIETAAVAAAAVILEAERAAAPGPGPAR